MIILFSTRHKRYRKAYLILLIKTWPTHSKTLVHHSVAFSVAVESNTRWRKIRTHWARLSGISEKTPFFWFRDFRSERVKRFNCALNEGTGTTNAQVSFHAMYQRRIDWPLSTIPSTDDADNSSTPTQCQLTRRIPGCGGTPLFYFVRFCRRPATPTTTITFPGPALVVNREEAEEPARTEEQDVENN